MSDYQQLLAELPSDWSTLPIKEVGEVISGGTPSRNNPSYWGEGIPWVTPSEVTGLAEKHLEYTEEKITTEGLAQSGAKLLPVNSLLITTRASLGAAALNSVPATTNQGFKSIAFGNHFSPHYYYHWSTKLKSELVRLASGTTFLEISGSEFRKVSVPVPPWTEQTHIARILDTLDTQIQKTEALIAKLEKVKEGLLHDLLTRGIDENGQLRPSPEQAPELYKDSPLGLIPREWEISSAGVEFEITSGVTLGTHRRPRKHPTPYLRVANVHRDRLVLDEITMLEMNPVELEGKSLSVGDLLIVEGHANPNEIGRCAKVTEEAAGLTFQNHLFKLRASGILAGFASLWMNSNLVRGYWRATCSTSSGLYTINRTQLSSVPVAKPSNYEQGLIASEYEKLQLRLQTETGQLAKMWLQKQGLMDDLLTGRVRVTPLLGQAQATTPA